MKKCLAILLVIALMLPLVACGEKKSESRGDSSNAFVKVEPSVEVDKSQQVEKESESPKVEESIKNEPENEKPAEDVNEQEKNDDKVVNGIRPDFKKTMDEYEKFFDEYVAFMKEFSKSNNTLSMMGDYTKMMAQYAITMKALEDLEGSEMSNEELVYYTNVMNRITQKLLEVAI